MACPYFYPEAKAKNVPQPARAPLGAVYEGRCELGGSPCSDACNFGYASGRCEVFPIDSGADAVRFTLSQGRLVYVLEKDYAPVRHGAAESLQGALRRQAEVFRSWAIR